jgi:hypothetical protein
MVASSSNSSGLSITWVNQGFALRAPVPAFSRLPGSCFAVSMPIRPAAALTAATALACSLVRPNEATVHFKTNAVNSPTIVMFFGFKLCKGVAFAW